MLTLTALHYLGMAIGGRLVSALAAYFCEDVGWRATNWLREDLTRHCLNLDRAFHSRYTPGELIERVDGNVDSLANFFSRFTVLVLGNALLVLGILILMARENVWLGIVMDAYRVISIFAYVRVQNFAIPYYKKHQQAEAILSGFWGEVLTSLEDIAASGEAPYILRRYVQLQRQENTAELKRICPSLIVVWTMCVLLDTWGARGEKSSEHEPRSYKRSPINGLTPMEVLAMGTIEAN